MTPKRLQPTRPESIIQFSRVETSTWMSTILHRSTLSISSFLGCPELGILHAHSYFQASSTGDQFPSILPQKPRESSKRNTRSGRTPVFIFGSICTEALTALPFHGFIISLFLSTHPPIRSPFRPLLHGFRTEVKASNGFRASPIPGVPGGSWRWRSAAEDVFGCCTMPRV